MKTKRSGVVLKSYNQNQMILLQSSNLQSSFFNLPIPIPQAPLLPYYINLLP